MKQSKVITSILLTGLLLFSCTEGTDLVDPPHKGEGEEVSVTIPFATTDMEAMGNKLSTRTSGQALKVAWGAAQTRVDTPKDENESKLNQVYMVQFSGTDATSTVVKIGKASIKTGAVTFGFFPTGCANRVYMVANVDLSTVIEGTTLSDFEARLETFAPSTSLPATGLPMYDVQEFEPTAGQAAPQFNLKAMVTKIVFRYKIDVDAGVKANPTITLKQVANGASYAGATDLGTALRPEKMTFSELGGGTPTVDGEGYSVYTFYVAENIAGKNPAVTKETGRSLAKSQPQATYIEVLAKKALDDEEIVFSLFLGDPTDVTDFNVQRNHLYTVTATILGFDLVDERVTMRNNLSASGTANCYMVLLPGRYTFNARTMGNGVDLGTKFSPADPLLTPKELAPKSAKMIWCTGTDKDAIVKNVTLSNGEVVFDTGVAEEGNAVIAVFSGEDGGGTVLWSWHIWRLKTRPASIACLKFDESGNSVPFTMMEYNLGAINNTPGNVGSLGLLYQWGRKDPFVNANATSGATAATTVTLSATFNYKTSGRSTVENSVLNPTTFFTNGSAPYDWLTVKNDNLWGNPWVSNKTVATQTVNSSEGEKSIYDPCPPGFRVPPQDTWTKAKNVANTANLGAWDTKNVGFSFTDIRADRQSLWFPGVGYRSNADGALATIGTKGHFWLSSPQSSGSTNGSVLYFIYDGTLNPTSGTYRASAFGVRCVSEH